MCTRPQAAVVATGASSGIGRACALALDQAGYRVFATVRQEQDAASLRQAASDHLAPVMMDVTDEGAVSAAAAAVAEAVGGTGLAGLVNNAGVAVPGPTTAVAREKQGSPPEVVACAVLTALRARRPRLRYPVGADATA